MLERGQEEEETENGDESDDFLEYYEFQDDLADGEEIDLEFELIENSKHSVGNFVKGTVVGNRGKTVTEMRERFKFKLNKII